MIYKSIYNLTNSSNNIASKFDMKFVYMYTVSPYKDLKLSVP